MRMHAFNVMDDVLHDTKNGRGDELEISLKMVAEEGKGAVVLIRDSWNSSFSNQIAMRQKIAGANDGKITESGRTVLRDYGVGAQILRNLGISNLRLLTNTKETTIKGIDGYGLKIVERVAIPINNNLKA